jgi:rhomboid protease GluP
MANCVQCGRQLPSFSLKKICQWCVQHEAAQRGEDGDNAKQVVMPTPWARRGESSSSITLTQVLFGANVAVFVAMVLASGPSLDFTGEVLVRYGANFGPYTLSGQWWRLLSYMFLHGSLIHIAFNMWCLWDLGALAENLYGRWTFAVVYLLTGVAGGVASVGWNPSVLSVGASGAVFGLAGALLASFYLGEFSLGAVAIKGTLRSLALFIGINVLFGSMFPGVDQACHIGGLISGLIAGALIARVAPDRDKPQRRVAVLLVVVLTVCGTAVGVTKWRGSQTRVQQAGNARRNADRMISALQTKVRQNPQDASSHYGLAQAYIGAQQISEAHTELKRVLELQPQNPQARMLLGAVYLRQRQAKPAQEQFAALVAQEPNNADAHYGLAQSFEDQQNFSAAIEEYKNVARLQPQAGGVYYRIGLCHAQLKQNDDAIVSFLKEKEQTGDDPDLESALADAYQSKGMTQQSQDARDKAAALRAGERD